MICCYYAVFNKERIMQIEQAVEFFGNQTKLAQALGIAVNAVSNWKVRGNEIPMPVQWQIELATEGMLRAGDCAHLLGEKEMETLRHKHMMRLLD